MLNEKIKSKLLKYQIDNTENIIRIIQNNGAVLDASDTGTGKTYSSVAVCATLKLRPLVICPKAVMRPWAKVCEYFNVNPYFIVNYETIKSLKYYNKFGKRILCPNIKYNDTIKEYTWIDIPEDVIFIFDEAHKCCNMESFNGKLILSTKKTKNKLIMLSATIADTVEKFKIHTYLLNFINEAEVKSQELDFNKYMKVIDNWLNRSNKPMVSIYNFLYPNRATRVDSSVLGKEFGETQISAIPYSLGRKREEEIQAQYEEIYDAMQELKNKKKKDIDGNDKRENPLVRVLRAHQRIELLKVPLFVELTKEFMSTGSSVVIFVNFTKTLETLAEMLKTNCLIYGEQTENQRQTNIELFQKNQERLIIVNIKAGGVGISLHDLDGKHQRISLISPCWSAIDMVQALGRVHRAGSKSISIQRILYTANTIEEKIAEKIQSKIKNLSNLNNGDVNIDNIVFEKKSIEM